MLVCSVCAALPNTTTQNVSLPLGPRPPGNPFSPLIPSVHTPSLPGQPGGPGGPGGPGQPKCPAGPPGPGRPQGPGEPFSPVHPEEITGGGERVFTSSSLVPTEIWTHNYTYRLTRCTFLPLWAPGSDSRSLGNKMDQSEERETTTTRLAYELRWQLITVQSDSIRFKFIPSSLPPPMAPFSPGGPGIPSCPWFPLAPAGPGSPGAPL